MKIIVFGAGAWGTALAISASSNPAAKHDVTLWARDAAQAAQMQDESWWKESRLIPVGVEMASVLSGYVETGRKVIDDVTEPGT